MSIRQRLSSIPPSTTETTYTIGVEKYVHLPSHRIRLAVQRGPSAGLACDVEAQRVTIGTGSSNDLRPRDRRVSRCHCEVVATDAGYILRDLGSKNGTFVKGMRILEVMLDPGSVITVGSTEVVFESSLEWVAAVHSGKKEFGELVGRSPAMRRTFGLLEKIAPSNLTVLIQGETGTGKELAAQALHQHSERAKGPFIVIDCAAVGPQFIEDKLFGHQRGAFTGANEARAGAFEEAAKGSVFLDEIGELPLELQPKLLRVLERREVTRIGSNKSTPVDVRVIAATHRRLEDMVNDGRFREDLYYRLAEVIAPLPSLAQREGDLPLLVRTILDRSGFPKIDVTEGALAHLAKHPWPGNVRELRNVLCRAATLCQGGQIDEALLLELEANRKQVMRPITTNSQAPGLDLVGATMGIKDATEAYRAAYVQLVQERFGDDVDAAAEHVGVHPKSLQRLYRQYR
ncbi:MAG: sigma 54-interacting transcriptional regulator [Myxococcales bacterium]|nr:sigma 54-interacting transcriptional regulator [Myxococcales bacterium]